MHQLKLVLLIACIWRSIFVHIWILRLCDLTITNILYHVIFTIPLIWIWLLCLHSPCRIHLFFCMASSQENLILHPLKCLVCQTNLLLPIVCVWRSITIHFGTLSLCVITINMVVSLYVIITIICTIPLIWICFLDLNPPYRVHLFVCNTSSPRNPNWLLTKNCTL